MLNKTQHARCAARKLQVPAGSVLRAPKGRLALINSTANDMESEITANQISVKLVVWGF